MTCVLCDVCDLKKMACPHASWQGGKKGGKKGGSGKAGSKAPEGDEVDEAAGVEPSGVLRYKPCPSFFWFFLPMAGGAVAGREVDPTAEGEDEVVEEEDDEGEGEGDEDGEEVRGACNWMVVGSRWGRGVPHLVIIFTQSYNDIQHICVFYYL